MALFKEFFQQTLNRENSENSEKVKTTKTVKTVKQQKFPFQSHEKEYFL